MDKGVCKFYEKHVLHIYIGDVANATTINYVNNTVCIYINIINTYYISQWSSNRELINLNFIICILKFNLINFLLPTAYILS
jgi:hypothetical protein